MWVASRMDGRHCVLCSLLLQGSTERTQFTFIYQLHRRDRYNSSLPTQPDMESENEGRETTAEKNGDCRKMPKVVIII